MSGIIKEALEYITDMRSPHRENVGGIEYADKELYPVIHNPKAKMIEMSTLTSLIDYIKSNTDEMADRMIVHIEGPRKVSLYSQLDNERKREHIVEVAAKVPEFRYESYMEHEKFCIALQAKFENDPESDRAAVLTFAGTVEDGTVAQYNDDGVTQKATVKTGIASKSDKIVPNPVRLRPYRTFHEVEQPISDFIFRMRSERGVECALFEADGGAWENIAMENVKKYLADELRLFSQFTVIS